MKNTAHDLLNTAARLIRTCQLMQARLRASFYPRPLPVLVAIHESKAKARRNIALARWIRENR